MPDPERGENLPEALSREVQRVTVVLGHYQEIGAPGAFGAMMIKRDLDAAHAAAGSGDVVLMLRALEALRGCQ